ncbi:Uncharacterised protein [uncultured archaeon]|nr:Uncharacterised protein [uncultured archaeon]
MMKDLTGKRFGRLIALAPHSQTDKRWNWLCLCDCGNHKVVASAYLVRSGARSCGCLLRDHVKAGQTHPATTHGMSKSPECKAFRNAKNRCQTPHYKVRGIQFLFASFEQWFAELGYRPSPQHSVDRKNNAGHYEPGNVRWATQDEQHSNRNLK